MAYTKQNFVDGNTLFASQLNYMEEGIARLDYALLPEGSPVYTPAQQSQMRTRLGAMATTPSGDPLHELYLALGATWNGGWQLNGISLTNDEIRFSFLKTGHFPSSYELYARSYGVGSALFANFKTTFQTIASTGKAEMPSIMWAPNLEVIQFTVDDTCSLVAPNSFELRYCAKLREVRDVIDFSSRTYNFDLGTTTVNLELLKLKGVKVNITARNQPLLSLESFDFLINNAINTTPITLRVASEVYGKFTDSTNTEWHSLYTLAAGRNINITE